MYTYRSSGNHAGVEERRKGNDKEGNEKGQIKKGRKRKREKTFPSGGEVERREREKKKRKDS